MAGALEHSGNPMEAPDQMSFLPRRGGSMRCQWRKQRDSNPRWLFRPMSAFEAGALPLGYASMMVPKGPQSWGEDSYSS